MAKKRKQFDEFLGGSESLPHEVSIMQFVSSRAREISAMTSSIENPRQTKLIFQKLPVYMRRRVMSHNVKRLPRRLREAHLAQMAKSANGQNLSSTRKRPSRKYRRRPRNLLSEYSRRQRNKIWLETHIWHAKRFRMTNKWGYTLASRANDKCYKANYEAVRDYCLLQDISYYTCVEIEGEENLLKTTLLAHCNTSILTFAAKIYETGNREGTVMFFKKNGHPHFPIGNVDFFWKPSESSIKTIWIWVHPAFYDEFLSEIISSFEFKRTSFKEFERDTTDVIHDSNYVYTNDAGCKMVILRYALNRFRLYGTGALDVLKEALQLPSLTELDFDPEMDCTIAEEQDSSLNNEKLDASKISRDNSSTQPMERMAVDESEKNITIGLEMDCTIAEQDSSLNNEELDPNKISTDNNSSTQPIERMAVDQSEENITTSKDLMQKLKKKCANWHTNYYKERENMEAFKIQKQFLQSAKFGKMRPTLNFIMGLTVLDPRFYLPEKKTECDVDTSPLSQFEKDRTNLNRSPIWDVQIRHIVSNSCVSTSTVNKLRSECLVPGISNDQYFNKDIIAKIPILLISKSTTRMAFGSSIDIIIPSKWAMPFWLAFIRRCARVGALRESRLVAFESMHLKVPYIYDPNSPAYMRKALFTKKGLTDEYFRHPPNQRINFTKFGIRSPFFCDWKNLTKGWSNVEDFYVLRNYNLLLLLQRELKNVVKRKNARTKLTNKNTFNLQDFDEYKNCLIPVELKMKGKGVPKKFAIICMPTQEDMEKYESDKKSNVKNDKKWIGPFEKCHPDPNENSRKILRKNHLLLLRRLRRRRVNRKKTFSHIDRKLIFNESIILDGITNKFLSQHRTIISAQRAKMSALYLPESTEVRHSCDREVMGYVTLGAYSNLRAKGFAIGYVTLASLLEIVSKQSNIVLVRNTTTRRYRYAILDIILGV